MSATEELADKIEEMLHTKGAFREVLPLFLDQEKFRFIVRRDIARVIEEYTTPKRLKEKGVQV